jgi:outer membrane protein assembly factor BamE (lipoprotein component of BamABCDE complex)
MAMHRTLVLALLAATTLLGACLYRPDIQQGNLLTFKDIDQVTVGMTRSQVRFLLGTPMVSDPFAPDRWDYVYRLVRGRDRRVSSAHFVVFFEGDKVVRVEMLDPPEPPGLPQKKQGRKQQTPPVAPPAAASTPLAAPSPDAVPPPAGTM